MTYVMLPIDSYAATDYYLLTMRLALKALLQTGSPVHAHSWDLPTQGVDGGWTPGRWSRVEGRVEYRRNGLHVCGSAQLPYWRGHLGAKGSNARVWVCEYRGAVSAGPNGFAAREVRLVRPWDGVEEIETGVAPVAYAATVAARVRAATPELTAASVERVACALRSIENGDDRAAATKRRALTTEEKRALTRARKAA